MACVYFLKFFNFKFRIAYPTKKEETKNAWRVIDGTFKMRQDFYLIKQVGFSMLLYTFFFLALSMLIGMKNIKYTNKIK